jgi:hydrogenase expression/formation protein HypD
MAPPSGFEDARFSDPVLCRRLAARIEKSASGSGAVALMEVCGTHTTSFFRHGIRDLLPSGVRLISGPGCPVCVTPTGYVDLALRLLDEPGVAIATFGDMVRVPGSRSSLERDRAHGRSVHVVYSPMDALDLARRDPAGTIVFLGVGFETTAPTVALAIDRAAEEGIRNFRVLAGHKLVPPALHALLSHPDLRIDGLILPGHVSVIIGSDAYRFVAERYGIPGVICGFDPVDLLSCVLDLVEMNRDGIREIRNRYGRYVLAQGNPAARGYMEKVFDVVDAEWRGLGTIPASGLRLKPRFAAHDAALLIPEQEAACILRDAIEPEGCRCGDVLRGTVLPTDCPLFGGICTPETPVGACMVSTEGTCAAYFRYARRGGAGPREPGTP